MVFVEVLVPNVNCGSAQSSEKSEHLYVSFDSFIIAHALLYILVSIVRSLWSSCGVNLEFIP